MGLVARLLEHPAVYEAWQAPFAARKMAPVLAAGGLAGSTAVLDLGCGPGTSTAYFPGARYVGVDLNPAYVAEARRRTGRTFVAADITTPFLRPGARFDTVLVNSVLHHLDDAGVRRVLATVAEVLRPGGRLHLLELVTAPPWTPAGVLARLDRGDYARPVAAWEALTGEALAVERVVPYPLGAAGVTLWSMVYIAARREG